MDLCTLFPLLSSDLCSIDPRILTRNAVDHFCLPAKSAEENSSFIFGVSVITFTPVPWNRMKMKKKKKNALVMSL
jgi:hypothetical protein